VWKVTSKSPVNGAVTVQLPLRRLPRKHEVVVALTAERRNGSWVPVRAALDRRGRTARIFTTHFSWFTALFADVKDAVNAAKRNIVDGLLSGALAEAVPPTCQNEAEARTGGFSISSDAKDTINWCFGVEGGRRVLRVVNRRRYPLSMSHMGLTTLSQGHWNGLAALARVGSGDRAIIAPRESMTFRVDAANGSTAVLRTEFDGVGQSLYQLQVGVQTALDLMTRFGFASTKTPEAAASAFATAADCATALENPGDAGAMLSKCFGVGNMVRVLGTKAILVAPLMFAGGLIEFFHSEFNAIGDQLNQRDQYTVTIASRAVPATTTTTTAPTADNPYVHDTLIGFMDDWQHGEQYAVDLMGIGPEGFTGYELVWNPTCLIESSGTGGCEALLLPPEGHATIIRLEYMAESETGDVIVTGAVFQGDAG
jgi:hypothetical protein